MKNLHSTKKFPQTYPANLYYSTNFYTFTNENHPFFGHDIDSLNKPANIEEVKKFFAKIAADNNLEIQVVNTFVRDDSSYATIVVNDLTKYLAVTPVDSTIFDENIHTDGDEFYNSFKLDANTLILYIDFSTLN